MRYPGGKFRCYQKLINLIPPHRVYIETHLGGGAVLRNKAPAQQTIGIDVDAAVIDRFIHEFTEGYEFIAGRAEQFLATYRFRGDEFIYADPPYWPLALRSQRSPYRFDYTEAEHVELLRLFRALPCAVMISGYANPVYERELTGWTTRTFPGTSHVGRRTETVWLNYHPTTLHDTRYLGGSFRERQTIKRKRQRWALRFRREPLAVQQAVLADLNGIFAERQREAVT
jgi:site-specific DNA-adenine methylase